MSRESFNRGNSPDYQCQIRIGARRRSTWRIALQLNPPTSFLLQFPSTTPWSSLLLLRRGGIGQQQKTFWMASRRISDIEIANMGGMNKWYGTCLECHYRPNTKSLRGAQTQRPSKSQGYVDRCEQVWPEHERRRSENRRRFVVRDIGMNVLSSDPIYMYKPPRRSLRRSEEQLLELHQEAIPCLFCMSTRGKGPVRNACRAPNASRSSN